MVAHEAVEALKRAPSGALVTVDGSLPEGLEEVALAGAVGAAQHKVLAPLGPIQRP